MLSDLNRLLVRVIHNTGGDPDRSGKGGGAHRVNGRIPNQVHSHNRIVFALLPPLQAFKQSYFSSTWSTL